MQKKISSAKERLPKMGACAAATPCSAQPVCEALPASQQARLGDIYSLRLAAVARRMHPALNLLSLNLLSGSNRACVNPSAKSSRVVNRSDAGNFSAIEDSAHNIRLHKHRDTDALLWALTTQAVLQHPKARADYWPTRAWRQFTWQPIYLSVAAVHGCQLRVSARQLQQRIAAGGIEGYDWIVAPSPAIIGATPGSLPGTTTALRLSERDAPSVERAAFLYTSEELARFVHQSLAALYSHTRVSRRNCLGLVADGIFFALEALQPQLGQTAHWVAETGASWCRALNLLDRKAQPLSQWIITGNHTGKLRRRSCCKSFLVGDQNYCQSCPLAGACAATASPRPTH